MTRPALDDALTAIRDVRTAALQVRAETTAAAELLTRAQAVTAVYRAKRLGVYSLDDAAALDRLAELVDALTGQAPR